MTHKYCDARIVLFARLPRPGQVKTRLQPALSAEQALDIHLQLFDHSLATLIAAKLCPVELWYDEKPQASLAAGVRQCHGSIDIHVQQGHDLGQRMQHALHMVLQRTSKVVLVGADCPAIDADYLATAIAKLNHSTPIVLGPAADGGYVLLAAQRADLHLFDAIEWGSAAVLLQTRARLQEQGINWYELPELIDIDRPEDLTEAARFGIGLYPHYSPGGPGT